MWTFQTMFTPSICFLQDTRLHPARCRLQSCKGAPVAAAGPIKRKQASRTDIEHIRTATSSIQLNTALQSRKRVDLEQLVSIHGQAARLLVQPPTNPTERHALTSILHQVQGQVLPSITKCSARQLTSLLEALYRTTHVDPVHLFVQSVVREAGRPSLHAALSPPGLAALATALSKNTQRLLSGQAVADPQHNTRLQQLLGQAWTSLAARACELAPKMPAQVACSLLASFARARHYDATVMDTLLLCLPQPVMPTAAVMQQPVIPTAPAAPQTVITTAPAASTIAAPTAPQVHASTQQVRLEGSAGPPDGGANINHQAAAGLTLAAVSTACWACATLAHPHPSLQGLVSEQLLMLQERLPVRQSGLDATGDTQPTSVTVQEQQERQGMHPQPNSTPRSGGLGHAASTPEGFTATDVANIAWSAAILAGSDCIPLIRQCVLCMLCPATVSSNTATGLCGTAVSSSADPEAGDARLSSTASDTTMLLWQCLRPAAATQMMQALLLAAMHTNRPVDLPGVRRLLVSWGVQPAAGGEFLAACHTAWCQATTKSAPSATQQQVFHALRQLGIEPQMEQLVADGLFSVDILVPWHGQQVVVEVDGPPHFCASPTTARQRPLGATQARHALLRACGFHLLSIHTEEWHTLQAGPTNVQLAGDSATTTRFPSPVEAPSCRQSAIATTAVLQWLRQGLDSCIDMSQAPTA